MQVLKNLSLLQKLMLGALSLVAVSGLVYLWFNNNKSDPGISGALDTPTTVQQESTSEESRPAAVTTEAIEYFKELALGAEYNQVNKRIHKWPTSNVLVSIQKEGTDRDRQCVIDTINDFNALSSTLKLSAGGPGNLEGMIQVIFAPESEFSTYEQYYTPTNYSYTSTYLDENQRDITYAPVLIDTATLTQDQRCRHVRTTLIKSLGFLNPSGRYSDSIFYTEGTKTADTFSAIDKQVIRFMYGDYGLVSNDNAATVDQKLNR